MAYDYKKQINFLIYKVERLVSALYMVTDFINSNDPLKWRMRKAGVVLLTEVGKLTELAPTDRKKVLRAASEAATESLSLLEVAANAGLISRMNYTLLKKEFANAPLLLERAGKTEPVKPIGQISKYSIGHSIGQIKIIKDKKLLMPMGQNSLTTSKVKKEARKEQIKKVFDGGKSFSLSEMSDMFRDFGSKMLQRDLNDLIKDGVLKKIGNKRWSRYSLAN